MAIRAVTSSVTVVTRTHFLSVFFATLRAGAGTETTNRWAGPARVRLDSHRQAPPPLSVMSRFGVCSVSQPLQTLWLSQVWSLASCSEQVRSLLFSMMTSRGLCSAQVSLRLPGEFGSSLGAADLPLLCSSAPQAAACRCVTTPQSVCSVTDRPP